MEDLADQIVRSSIGAGTLALLELEARPDVLRLDWNGESSPAAVDAGCLALAELSFAGLCGVMLQAAELLSPWDPSVDEHRQRFGRDALRRRPLAEELIRRFDPELSAGFEPDKQELWVSHKHRQRSPSVLFRKYDKVYDDGQFTWAGLWSVTAVEAGLRSELSEAWELTEGYDRWHMPVLGEPRFFEITSLADWRRLIDDYGQGGAAQPRVPDWSAIATTFDVIHLSWLGFLTAHDDVAAAAENGVVPLRYWGGERSLWLNHCFGQLRPTSAEQAKTVAARTGAVVAELLDPA